MRVNWTSALDNASAHTSRKAPGQHKRPSPIIRTPVPILFINGYLYYRKYRSYTAQNEQYFFANH